MFNLENTIKECVNEINCENEKQAKATIKSILAGIIYEQNTIKNCNKKIEELQKNLKIITVQPVDL